MTDPTKKRDPVECLADDFIARQRRGESPSIAEYIRRFPEHASRIATLFPAIDVLEGWRNDEATQRLRIVHANAAVTLSRIGDFNILREIGRGGMGIVYEAEQRSLHRRVALKVLPKHIQLIEDRLARFHREAQMAAGLHHTNIVTVFGVGESDGLHYYVMPLVKSVGLDEIIDAQRPDGPYRLHLFQSVDLTVLVKSLVRRKFGNSDDADANIPVPIAAASEPGAYWNSVALIAMQAADALSHAHAHDVLHRDVKPGNLLVDGEGVVRVADFGLARVIDQAGRSTSADDVGTLAYMAPEQWCDRADARSDLYSFGATFYELLTLQPAFRRDDIAVSHQRGLHHVRKLVAPRDINRRIPRDLETIVLKCLAPEPKNRYQTAGDLADDLRRYLANRPIKARPVSLTERIGRWCRRNPAMASMTGLAACLLCAVIVVTVTALVQTRHAYQETTHALRQAEDIADLTLATLDGIYAQLAPNRHEVSIDPAADERAYRCLGLSPLNVSRPDSSLAAPVSRETAALLKNLLVVYDQLADRQGGNARVRFESAIARRRVGNIRQQLGQFTEAETEYRRAIARLKSLANVSEYRTLLPIELARNLNAMARLQSARLEINKARETHREALVTLRTLKPGQPRSAAYRFELARTFYSLANMPPVHRSVSREAGYGADRERDVDRRRREYRWFAVRLLEELAAESPDTPDYRFFLALCQRPARFDFDDPAEMHASRQRAIDILTSLLRQYPEVADYRHELIVTLARVNVGLFPWETDLCDQDAETDLKNALRESQRLVAAHPQNSQFAQTHILVQAKLGTIYWRSKQPQQAADMFREALDSQKRLITAFPALPSYHRVLLEFLRLRLGQIAFEHALTAEATSRPARELLEITIKHLTQLTTESRLASDRLALSTLSMAYDTLYRLYRAVGETEQAATAKFEARRIHAPTSDRWQSAALP